MEVIVSGPAQRSWSKILDYVAREFSTNASDDLEIRMDALLKRLKNLPYQWPVVFSQRYGPIHKASLTSNTVILYQIRKTTVFVVAILDTRTNWL